MLAKVALRLLLLLFGLLLSFALIEGILFRFVLLAPDIPTPEFKDGVIRYRPNQSGTYRVGDEIAARYSINNQGWNSPVQSFLPAKPDKPLIVIIGDSYVEAFAVDYRHSFAEEFASKLDPQFTVYRMGISGAPLSQYLQMFRLAALPLQPSLVIINLVHNDFEESYEFKPGLYTSSFLKLRLNSGGVEELQPREFVQPWYAPIRATATWRYLAYRRQIRLQTIRDLLLGAEPAQYQANIDTTTLASQLQNMRLATSYLMHQFAAAANEHGTKLLFMMDGDRQALYSGQSSDGPSSPLLLNALAGEAAAQEGIPFLDLEPAFTRDFSAHHQKFNSNVDFHWNEYGHRIVAEELVTFLGSHPELLQAPSVR